MEAQKTQEVSDLTKEHISHRVRQKQSYTRLTIKRG